jgi:8-amino-7-oxononanoate synthase
MGIFDKFQSLAETRKILEKNSSEFFNVVIDDVVSPTEVIIRGQKTLLFGGNNYLGLTFNAECIRAACEAIQKDGTGTTGSRVANGTFSGHLALENELSEFFGRRSTTIFSTGYIACMAMLSTLVGRDEVILLDADGHASLYDGCRMSGADVIRFRHSDVQDLEKRLQRLEKRNTNVLIVVEGIYSMLGDRAPLAEIAALKNRYGAYLLIDEAHSLGVLGETGRGLSQEAGVEESVDFVVGTFSKSLGATGGFCTSNHPEFDLVRYGSRPYIFTASSSPSIIASTRMALRILRSQPELRRRLWDNANQLYQRLKDLGFSLGPTPSPIIAICLDDPLKTAEIWKGLLHEGIYVNMVLPPATPTGGALLRCSLSSLHTREQIERIGDAFATMKAKYLNNY